MKGNRRGPKSPRGAIVQLAKAIGDELESDAAPSEEMRAAGPMLAVAGAAPQVVACLLAETRRGRPDDRLIQGCVFLLETALESLRLASNGGDVAAGRAIDDVRQAVRRALTAGYVEPAMLMLVARVFAQAGLDADPAVQEAMAGALDAEFDAMPAGFDPGDLATAFDEIAEHLGQDPFAIHAELAGSGSALPAEHRVAMVRALALSSNPAVREAVLGFALATEPEISAAALEALAETRDGNPVASVTVERLVRIRPWLAGGRQAHLDAAVRALRPRVAPPIPAPRPEIGRLLASLCDGAGAQSVFALVQQGRQFALASVLVKNGVGIADTLLNADMSRGEADAMVTEIVAATEAVEISMELVERRLGDALAANVARDAPPPFGLLRFVEALGLEPLQPASIPPAVLADALLAGLPAERTGPDAEQAADRASAAWGEAFDAVASWYEAGEAVEALLRPLRTRKQRIEALVSRLLPGRRGFWAERCAWMAATLKESAAKGDESWCDFALVARGLAGTRPLETMPLSQTIAAATVDAFVQR